MTTRKQVRRALLLAAVSTAMTLNAADNHLFGVESSVKASNSGIQRVQYQPGQGGPSNGQQNGQPNSAVAQELKRMFEESGQPMPSMNPNDLPNAQGQQAGMVRQAQPSQGQSAAPQQQSVPQQSSPRPQQSMPQQTAKASQPAKKNFLQKFMGKVSGQEKKVAEAAVVPPVPPGYKEPAPAPPSGGTMMTQSPNGQQSQNGQQSMLQPQNRQANGQMAGGQQPQMAHLQQGQMQNNAFRPASNGKVLPNNGTVQNGTVRQNAPQQNFPQQGNPQTRMAGNSGNHSGMNSANAASTRMAQTAAANGQHRVVQQPGGPIPAVPSGARSSVPAVPAATRNKAATTASNAPSPRSQQYLQPGTAPAFMPANRGSQNAAAQTAQTPQAVPAAPPASSTRITAKLADDGFEDPFNEAMDADPSDVLDLDAIAMPSETNTSISLQQETSATPSVATVAPAHTTASSPKAPAAAPSAAGEQLPFVDEVKEQPRAETEEVNPFTGVHLKNNSEEMFDAGHGAPTATPAPKAHVLPFAETTSDADSKESFGDPAPPMEDFGTDLPAISLPPVDELGGASTNQSPGVLTIPDLNGKDAGGSLSVESKSKSTPVTTSTTNPVQISGAKGNSSGIDVTEPSSAPLRSVDTERLQQAAEQDRRLRQQRLIQSRAGQYGFKGFCPVELRDKRELVDCKPEFTATFGLQTYSFSSSEARTAFEADPSRYAPAAGGSDVVLLVNSGEEQPGMLDYAMWYRDRLYLFRSRETMAMFNNDPLRFANQY